MHYLVYKTTNLINGKYYIGAHSSPTLTSTYLGSGVELREAIRVFGKKNFKREILFQGKSLEEIHQKEAELLTPAVRDDPLCYNVRPGGFGSFLRLKYGDLKAKQSTEEFMRKIGQSKSESKTLNAQKNGKLGGRPKGAKTQVAHGTVRDYRKGCRCAACMETITLHRQVINAKRRKNKATA